ncbi:hypothetical protein B0H13DRAFT_1865613 [Mycena leptocephala]|nr:hypothetical protein B0H13DRAFT_1865613 [Mycena leptocephala]
MPKAALGQNLEPLYTALVPACCLHLAQSHGGSTKPDPERYFWKYWVCRPRGKNKRMSAVDAHKWVVSRMMLKTLVLLEDGDGDRVFIVMREALDYAIGILL